MPDSPGLLFEMAAQFRRELLRRERAASSRLVRAYGQAWRRIRRELEQLQAEIDQARLVGEVVDPAWLRTRYRLRKLQVQVEAEIGRFAEYADEQIRAEQAAAVAAAGSHAARLTTAAPGPAAGRVSYTWNRVPTEAVGDLVGFLADGSPLALLLAELGPATAVAVGAALTTGLALGHNPRKIAAEVRQAVGMGLTRALRISRTEVLRSYREATRRNYQGNDDVVKGWLWHAHVSGFGSERTCGACWAMHGTQHTLDERLDDHVCGRCAMIPIVKSWAELGSTGIADTQARIPTGVELFARLPAAEQDRILGRAAGAAYRDGAATLEDFVGQKHSPLWGTMRYQRSLREVLGAEEAKRWITKARTEQPFGARIAELTDAKKMIEVGQLPPSVRQHWPNAASQRIVLTGERRSHYLANHRDVHPYEAHLQRVVTDPDEVHRNKRDAQIAILYRQVDEEHWLRAALWISDKPDLGNSIHSYRLAGSDEVQHGRRGGRSVCRK
jgi:hypothetical protein